MFGLSHGNLNTNYTTINYALYTYATTGSHAGLVSSGARRCVV